MDEFTSYCGDSKGFATWLKRIDAALVKKYGLGVFDLPDQSWRDWYEDGWTQRDCIAAMKEGGDIW